MAASDRVIIETSKLKAELQDYDGNRYHIRKEGNGYQAYYYNHDHDNFEIELEDVPYTPHLGLRSNDQSETSATLINHVRTEMQNLFDIINKPEVLTFRMILDEIPAQILNTMQYVQVLAEYLEITVSKLPSHDPTIVFVTNIVRDLRDTSHQAIQIADILQEDQAKTFEGSQNYKEYLKQLSILVPRIHHQVNRIYGQANANQVFTSNVTGDSNGNTDIDYATLTASIGVAGEGDHMGDSYALNSVTIYNDYINDIEDPTDQEMVSMLISIMGDENTLGYIEKVMSRRY
jgi:hypothetical protein